MKQLTIGITVVIPLLALSITTSPHYNKVRLDVGHWEPGVNTCTAAFITYHDRVSLVEDLDCVLSSGIFCYYTVASQAPSPCSGNFFSFSNARFKL